MSGNNSYPKHREGTNRNNNSNYSRNPKNDNDNGNSYHLRNPYSPHGKISQQQQQTHQPNALRHNTNHGNNSSDSRRPFNPYSQMTQQQGQPIPNQYDSAINRHLPFAIKSVESLDYQQQQQQQQQQQSIDKDKNININPSRHSERPQTNHHHHQQQEERPHQPPQHQEHQDLKALLEKLKDQLDQSNESNFELEASVMALEAELKHTKETLKEQAESERSKLEHELRLAQQESKRWKLLAQQKGRSIVRDAETMPQITSANAFSNRLLGDPAGLRPSSPKETSIGGTRDREEDLPIDAQVVDRGKHQTEKSLPESHQTRRYQCLSQQQRLQHKNIAVSRLARNLLEQVEPFAEYTRNLKEVTPNTNQSPKETTRDSEVLNLTSTPKDIETGEAEGRKFQNKNDDASIRRVLFSIASATSNENLDAVLVHNKHTWQQSDLTPSIMWTEGKLVEWLVVTFSSETSDRYWSTLILQSPEARKYVREKVCFDWVPGSESNKGHQSRQQQKKQHQHQHQQYNIEFDLDEPRRRRRRNRIRPTTSEDENHGIEFDEWQTQARRSLRTPWWNPNDLSTINGMNSNHNDDNSSNVNGTKSLSSSEQSSSLAFREWAASLAASWNIRHLHTLRILLAEEAGRKDLAIGINDHEFGTWWSLCYPSIAVTIQRIVYGKLIRSKNQRDKRGLASIKLIGNRSSNNQRNATATNENNGSRRYRIGMFLNRLESLPQVGEEGRDRAGTTGSEGKASFDTKNIEEEKEDDILAYSLCVWVGLLHDASPEQLEVWHGDQRGLITTKDNEVENLNDSPERTFLDPPSGGLFMVSMLLDLLEELQFDWWASKDSFADGMSLSLLLSTGVHSDEKARKAMKYPSRHSNTKTQESCDKDGSDPSTQLSSNILPRWYDAAIAVLTQVGKTRGGMRILRSRVMDAPERSDWMGNSLDVSIRQLHALALHLDDVRTRHGSILRFDESTGKDGGDIFWGGDPLMADLLRSVEAWVRLWHQVLLFAQSTESVSFRTLVLHLQDWFTSTSATLLASREVRPEIKAMIRWQLDELMMDEEDYEESKGITRNNF